MARGMAEIARRAYEAFDRGGVEAILEFLEPDVEWRMWERFARTERIYRGHDGVREVISIFEENLDDFAVEPHNFVEVGEHVVVPVRLSGRDKGTNAEQSYELVQVWTTNDRRRAERLDVYEDSAEAFESIGSADPRATS